MPRSTLHPVAAAALLVLVAATAAAAPSSLHRAANAEAPSLDPSLGSSTIAAPIIADLVEGLVARTPALQPAPACAERWTVSDDGLTWTFRLRPGLRWSDGTPLTAEDFVYSYRRLLDPGTGAPSSGLFFVLRNARQIATRAAPPESLGVSAPDGRTVEFELEFPAPYFLQLLANTQAVPVPRHVIAKEGRDWARPGTMVSNGPYVLAERIPQSYTKLVRNGYYYAADEVGIDEIYWHPNPDMGTALRRFRAGELDVVLNVSPDDLGWVRENMPEALRGGPMHATYTLVFNTAKAPFDDARVRRALSLAIDRDAIAGQLLRSGVRPAWSWVSPGIGGYTGITVPEQDLPVAERQAEARSLLAAAGFSGRKPLTVPLIYDTQEENRKIMVAIAGMWQAIGVRTELDNQEFGAVLGRLRSRNFDVVRSSTFSLYDDPFAYLQQLAGGAPNNWSGYANPAYDELLVKANGSTDAGERLQLFMDAERLASADQPLIPIYHYHGKLLLSPRVRGWWDASIGTPPSRWLSVQ